MKVRCVTAAALSALILAISVFIGNIGHTEYKSQIRKRKARKTSQLKQDLKKSDSSETLA